jgi:hypothetical protein
MTRRRSTGRGRTKEARALEKAVIAAGGTVERTGSGHLKVRGPEGMAVTTSDPGNNSMRTAISTIEKYTGLTLNYKQ